MNRALRVVVTCEHASSAVPSALRLRFADAQDLLKSHRGYDAGALSVARLLAGALEAPLIIGRVSRLVVDLNRSLGHRRLFSELTKSLPPRQRDGLLDRWYHSFRAEAFSRINPASQRRPVLHLSIHTFTPVLDGNVRNVDIGLLYDPARAAEARFARRWQKSLRVADPSLRVRMNQPYRGIADGHTTALRQQFADGSYLGIELEINQRLLTNARQRSAVARLFIRSIQTSIR